MEPKILGLILRAGRKRAGLTQTQAAARFFVPRVKWNRWENGIGLASACRFIEAFLSVCSMNELVNVKYKKREVNEEKPS